MFDELNSGIFVCVCMYCTCGHIDANRQKFVQASVCAYVYTHNYFLEVPCIQSYYVSMYVSMYVCMYVCMYVFLFNEYGSPLSQVILCMYVCMYVCMYDKAHNIK